MNHTKRITAILLLAALALTALTACGKNAETEAQTTAAEPVTETAAAAETTALNEENETAAEEVSEAETTDVSEETSEAEAATQDAAPESAEEIVAFYNTAVNRVKPEAKQITRTYHHVNIPTESLELPSSIQGIGQTAIMQFVKGSDKAEVWTSREDFNLGFPVGGTGYSSKMTPDMVKTATYTDITFDETDVLDLDVKVAFSNMHAKMNLVTSDHYKIVY